MKCVMFNKTKEVIRTSDESAKVLVESAKGWHYVPKSTFKSYVQNKD